MSDQTRHPFDLDRFRCPAAELRLGDTVVTPDKAEEYRIRTVAEVEVRPDIAEIRWAYGGYLATDHKCPFTRIPREDLREMMECGLTAVIADSSADGGSTTVRATLGCPECGNGDFYPIRGGEVLACGECDHRWTSDPRTPNQRVIDEYERAHKDHNVNTMDDWFEVAKRMKELAEGEVYQ